MKPIGKAGAGARGRRRRRSDRGCRGRLADAPPGHRAPMGGQVFRARRAGASALDFGQAAGLGAAADHDLESGRRGGLLQQYPSAAGDGCGGGENEEVGWGRAFSAQASSASDGFRPLRKYFFAATRAANPTVGVLIPQKSSGPGHFLGNPIGENPLDTVTLIWHILIRLAEMGQRPARFARAFFVRGAAGLSASPRLWRTSRLGAREKILEE